MSDPKSKSPTASNLLKQIRNSTKQTHTDSLIQKIAFTRAKDYSPKDQYTKLRGELIDLLMTDFDQHDHYLLQRIADIEMEHTTSLNYHHRQADVVFMLYELGNKEDVFRAYDVKYRSRNMDAACAAYDATLTMRTPKDVMVDFIKVEITRSPELLERYPDILESIDFSYEFSNYGSKENFEKGLVGYYYGQDEFRVQRFYNRMK